MNLEMLKRNALIFDIETSALYDDGREVSINSDDYLVLAQCKWFGAYSYKDDKEYYLEVAGNRELIREILHSHNVLVGFNSSAFDYPILVNNGLISEEQRVTQVDCMTILGASNFKDKDGYGFKGRGGLMGYKFKTNSLECMAKTMELEFQKSEIDYEIFHKDTYTEEEKEEIIYYLRNDVMATKGLFDKLWDYWKPFTDMLDEKNIINLSWIRSSIASLVYKSVCYELGTEPTYGKTGGSKEEMGGNVLMPKHEEVEGIWYVDFTSLYPHIFCMFNLFSEVDESNVDAWHGNDVFKVKGYYDISHQSQLSKIVQGKLKQRGLLKANDPKNPMAYTIKIFLNGLYGVVRSPIFEKVHSPNAGWDTCWLGQQIKLFARNMLDGFGFESVYEDTDSCLLKPKTPEVNNRKYVQKCLDKVIQRIFSNVPFPVDTFDLKIENYLEYVLFPFSEEPILDEETRKLLSKNIIEGYEERMEGKKKVLVDTSTGKVVRTGRTWVKERTGIKKNYMYLYEDKDELKIEIVGLPIMKDGATPLGMKIFNEVLKPMILETKKAKFSKKFIDDTITEYLKNEEILRLLAREFKVKNIETYKIPKGKKEAAGIHAQISRGYFNGKSGVIHLIKNSKVGKAGKGEKYCTISEAREAKLTIDDLGLDKVYKELEPFVKYEPKKVKSKP